MSALVNGKVTKRKSTTVLQESTENIKKKCTNVLQAKVTPNTVVSKRRYVDRSSNWPNNSQATVRPDLPTPPIGEESPDVPHIPTIPLPPISFASNTRVWNGLKAQEDCRHAHKLGVLNHPHITQRTRAILLDWLIEVSELYLLHRETYYLAMDYIDRYLSCKPDITRDKLQLIGITSLHIAAKLEEIYPPVLKEFAFVTDNSCTEEEICEMELEIMKAVNWRLSALTVNTWLNLYLQIDHFKGSSCTTLQFMRAEYSQLDFVKIIQLIDLCSLDVQSAQFKPSIIAASALWLVVPFKLQEVTGYSWEDLYACRHWMQPYAKVIASEPAQRVKEWEGKNIAKRDAHNIQTHFKGLRLLAEAFELQSQQPLTPESESENEEVAHYLTPPSSTGKHR